MRGRLLPAAIAALQCAVLAAGLAACAPQRILLMPAPPTEVRKEPQAPAAGPGSPIPSPPAPPAVELRAVPPPPPPDPVAAYAEAVDRTAGAIRDRRPTDAIPYWIALEESRWGTDAVFNQGVLLQLSGDADGAVARYGRLADKTPAFEPAAANLLGIHLVRGDREKMAALLARVLPPGPLTSWNGIPELRANAAAALAELGRTEEAAAVIASLEAGGLRTPSLPWTAAVIAYRRGERDDARKRAAGLPPDIADLFPVIASRFALGDGTDIPRELPAVPHGQPRLTDLSSNLAGFSEYRKGNVAAGERALSQRGNGDPPLPEISTNLGLLQAEQGKWREARANLERAVRGNPAPPEGWLNLGIFREVYEGDLPGARECYENYVRLRGLRSEEVRTWLDRLGQSAPRQ